MSKPMIKIHNIETDEIIEREMTNAEAAAYEEAKTKTAAQDQAIIDQRNAKIAMLERIGLTAEEAASLGL